MRKSLLSLSVATLGLLAAGCPADNTAVDPVTPPVVSPTPPVTDTDATGTDTDTDTTDDGAMDDQDAGLDTPAGTDEPADPIDSTDTDS